MCSSFAHLYQPVLVVGSSCHRENTVDKVPSSFTVRVCSPGTDMVEGENQLYKLPSDLYMYGLFFCLFFIFLFFSFEIGSYCVSLAVLPRTHYVD